MSLCPGCFKEKGTTHQCEHCEYDESLKRSAIVLPHLTHLNHDHYIVGRLLGKPGGFGLTYLGWDLRLNKRVAIKEYLPRTLSSRDPDHCTVNSHSRDDAESFEYGLKRFLEEARTLAQIEHPNVVRVRDYFEENGTAYLVMDYYDGITLDELLKTYEGKVMPWQQSLDVILPILDGLKEVHSKGFLHRDIKPHNIYITATNKPILLDFGAARQSMGEKSNTMSVVLSEGYAPFEQYQRNGRQGPWTDVYGAASTLHTMLTGLVYISPLDQISDPDWRVEEILGDINRIPFIEAIGKALELYPEDRTQSISDFQNDLLSAKDLWIDKWHSFMEATSPENKACGARNAAENESPRGYEGISSLVQGNIKKISVNGLSHIFGATAAYYMTVFLEILLKPTHMESLIPMLPEGYSYFNALFIFLLYFSPAANTVIRSKDIAYLSFVVCVITKLAAPAYNMFKGNYFNLDSSSLITIGVGIMASFTLYMCTSYLRSLNDD